MAKEAEKLWAGHSKVGQDKTIQALLCIALFLSNVLDAYADAEHWTESTRTAGGVPMFSGWRRLWGLESQQQIRRSAWAQEESSAGVTRTGGVDTGVTMHRLHSRRKDMDIGAESRHAAMMQREGGVDIAMHRLADAGVTKQGKRRRLWDLYIKQQYRHAKRTRSGECWSRSEQPLFYSKKPMSPELEKALEEYMEMHRRCTEGVDWAGFPSTVLKESQEEGGRLKGCQYLLYEPPDRHGLGNRLMALVSVFTFALLSNRAILLGTKAPVALLVCNPMRSSDWTVDGDVFTAMLNEFKGGAKGLDNLDNIWEGWDKRAMHIAESWNTGAFAAKLYCEETHEDVIRHIPVLSFESDTFLVPGLYFVRAFREKLLSWFPDGLVFLHVGRLLIHPKNHVWLRISAHFDAYMRHYGRLVGVQMRRFWDRGPSVQPRMLQCLLNASGAIPLVHRISDLAAADSLRALEPPKTIGVLVTSLDRSHSDFLKDYFGDVLQESGEPVAVVSFSHEGEEKQEDVSQYQKAFEEMILLSFCDHLLVTDYSTFGYVASGLSGVRPYSMNIVVLAVDNWETNGRPDCVQISSEPCYHSPPGDKLQCKGADTPFVNALPYIGTCDGINQYLALNVEKYVQLQGAAEA